MKLPPFALERYFAAHEFSVEHLLCASDCESHSVGEVLAFEPGARERLDEVWLGYTESAGHPQLREAIASLYRTGRAADVLVHAGAEEAIFNFMHAVAGPGDHVVVHWPCYQSLFQVAESIGCQVGRWEAKPGAGWRLDLDELKRALRPNTKAVVLNCPHNPTGYLMEEGELREAVKIVEGHGAVLFMDEVYKGLEYEPGAALAYAYDLSETAVSLGVMSKSLGLAGLRIGWVATKNRAVLGEMAKLKDYTSMCNSAPSEFLSVVALRHREKLLRRNRGIIAENLALLDRFFAARSDRFEWVRPKAGCIAFPKVLQEGADAFCERVLTKAGVLLAPGSKFSYDGHFRLGFGRRNFPSALAALEKAL